MSSKIVPFDLLIEGVLDQLKSKGYLESTLIVYRRIYARVRTLLGQCNTEVYTPEIGEKFLAGTDVRKSTYAAYACAIRRLNDFINGKPFRSHHDCPHTQTSPEFSCILDEYLRKCMNNGNKARTLQFKERTCALFLDSLIKDGCSDLAQMDVVMVSRALLTFSNGACYGAIRQFLRFLADKEITKRDLSGIVPRHRQRKPIPTSYTPEEISKIEATIDTHTDTGKRNLAIIRLATRMGLRSGDIAKLKLADIDFNMECINIIQEKTGIPISLRMPAAVSSALAAHIESDERSSVDGYVFHSRVAPYEHITTSIIRHAINACFTASNVDTADRRHGPHAFRSSLASSMVNDGISYEVVRRILGHSSMNVIKHYARVDIQNLRRCSIDPPAPTGRFNDYLSGKEVISHV